MLQTSLGTVFCTLLAIDSNRLILKCLYFACLLLLLLLLLLLVGVLRPCRAAGEYTRELCVSHAHLCSNGREMQQ